jgi:hypothetical protein
MENIEYRLKSEVCVLISEDWGWQEWFWFPQMTKQELVAWWREQLSIPWPSDHPEAFPGDLILIKKTYESELWTKAITEKIAEFSCLIDFEYVTYLADKHGDKIYHSGAYSIIYELE